MKSKWLRFRLASKGYKTSVWRVENKSRDYLGCIKWYPQWRQYCFISAANIKYSQGCLGDIAGFIKEQMDKRKQTNGIQMRKNLGQVWDRPYQNWVLIDVKKCKILEYRRKKYLNVKIAKRNDWFLGGYR